VDVDVDVDEDDDADDEDGVVVVGADFFGALGLPFPCASTRPGSRRPVTTRNTIAEGSARCLTSASR
jgi:hypothetical protein